MTPRPQHTGAVRTAELTAGQELVDLERVRGTADMQKDLAKATVNVDIQKAAAAARSAQAEGEATFVRLTGQAEADRRRAIGLAQAKAIEALGLAKAAGYEAQVSALGQSATAAVAVAGAVADGHVKIVPDVLVGSADATGAFTGLAATMTGALRTWGSGPARPTASGGPDVSDVSDDSETSDVVGPEGQPVVHA